MCPPLQPVSDSQPAAPSIAEDVVLQRLPATALAHGAYQLAQSLLPASILNHSIRVFLFAEWFAQREQSEWATDPKRSLLAVACLLHDIGCATRFDGPQRFEVEGADAAASYLRQHNVSESDVHEVWQSIALHTSAGIAERISTCARLVRQGVLMDFGKAFEEGTAFKQSVEVDIPRLAVEKDLGDVVVDQALKQPQKAPAASWPGILLRAKRDYPNWTGVNKAF